MGYKHDALTTLLTHHTPHQQPPWVPSDQTALVILSWALVCLIRLTVEQGINLTTPILGLSLALVANRIRLRPATQWQEIIHLLHLPAQQQQALRQALYL
ncbi:hypothetical protein BDW71DRAFT_212847 [Aspergillus fruticulosus]